MTSNILTSQKGIAFTKESADVMRDWTDICKKDNLKAIIWSVTFNREGKITIGLGSDHTPHPLAIPDQLENVEFYWYAEQKGFDAIRPYCMDIAPKRKSRLLKLPSMEPLYENWQNI